MKRFQLQDYAHIKYVILLLGIILLLNAEGTPTGFVIDRTSDLIFNNINIEIKDSNLIDITLNSREVQLFFEKNPEFKVAINEISTNELNTLKSQFPELYSNLPNEELSEIVYYSGLNRILIIIKEDKILKTMSTN